MNILDFHHSAILTTEPYATTDQALLRSALMKAGAVVDIISTDVWLLGENDLQPSAGGVVLAGRRLEEADPAHYHSVVLCGDARSSTLLRTHPQAKAFIDIFLKGGGGIAIMGTGFLAINDLRLLANKCMAAPASLRIDLTRAGAVWKPGHVVTDGWLVTADSEHYRTACAETIIDVFSAVTWQRNLAS